MAAASSFADMGCALSLPLRCEATNFSRIPFTSMAFRLWLALRMSLAELVRSRSAALVCISTNT